MDEDRWRELVGRIEGDDVEQMAEASEMLEKESTADDIPRLLELLSHTDLVVREAAAWPLSIVGGPALLPKLFDAYQQAFDEGHDNDGFLAALIQLVELRKDESRLVLAELSASSNPIYRQNAKWLSEFC